MAIICASLVALSAFGADTTAGTGPCFKGPLGLQLYSLRNSFPKDVTGTLDIVKGLGFRYAELAGTYGMTPDAFTSQLKERNIKPVAAHFSYDQWKNDPEKACQEAKALGLEYAGLAWIPHDGPFTEKLCREAIQVFNKAGEVAQKNGLKFFYHNHGYEFQPYKDGTLFDLLVSETNPKNVLFEMDIFWIVHPGQNPVTLLEKYSDRWQLMHLKDMKKGLKGNLSGGADVTNDVAMGAGQMDLPAILKAAKKAGIKYYFIEDESPSVLEQLPQSIKYLETVKF